MSESAPAIPRRDPLPAGLAKLLDNPLAGLSPWIVFALVEGPGRLELAAGLSFAAAAVILGLGRVRAQSLKLLEVSDVVFFGLLGLAVAFASAGTRDWLETWSGEVANVALVVVALGSMLAGRPFTLQYARENVDPSLWRNPVFVRTNYAITGAWALAFVVAAAAGACADGPLGQPDNFWLTWVVGVGAILLALQFTRWYPEVARARARGTEAPSVAGLAAPLTGWLTVIGIISLSADAAPGWVGYAFIAAGILSAKAVHAVLRDGDGDGATARRPA